MLKVTQRLLEVGCGTGMLARRLQEGLDFVGVDPVASVVERLRRQLPAGRFEVCAAHEVPFELFAGRVVLINSVRAFGFHAPCECCAIAAAL